MRPAPAALMLALAATPLAAQDGAFVVRLGDDTLAVERFTRSATRLEGLVVARSPRVVQRRYVVELGSGGSATRMELVVTRPGAPAGAPPQLRAVAVFTRDSVVTELWRDTATETVRLASPAGTVPLVSDSWASFEMMAGAARRSRADSVRFATYTVGAPRTGWVDVRRLGRDSVLIVDENQTHRALVDGEGRLLGAARPEQRFAVLRVPALDASAVAAAWAAREQRGGAMGQLSPRDTARATIAGAHLMVDYSRPSKRGRTVFGGVVPWHAVWRTGANAATQLTTDRDLEMGGVRLPAGSYSLFTIPSPSGWKLLINAQTQQAGTDHDPTRDLFHLDMTTRTLSQPVEQFTISIEPEGQGGVLRLRWDTTEASIPLTVR